MTIGELKKIINSIPDDTIVYHLNHYFELTPICSKECGVFEIQDPTDELDEYTKIKAFILTLQGYDN